MTLGLAMNDIFAGDDALSRFVVDLLLYPRVVDKRIEDFVVRPKML